MRDPERCEKFCKELAMIWQTECPDWRFSQLIANIFSSCPSDPWFWEEDKMLNFIRDYFQTLKQE